MNFTWLALFFMGQCVREIEDPREKKKEKDSSKYPKSRPLRGKEALVTLAEMSPGSKCVSQSTALLFTLSDKTVSPFFLQRSWLSLLLLSWH